MKKDEYYKILSKMFSWLNQLAEKKDEINKNELEEFFTEDLQICTNNQSLVGIDKFHKHLQESISQYAHAKIIFPFKAYISDQKQVALYYFLKSVTLDDQVFEYCVMSIFKFRNSKISTWYEVVSEIDQQ